MSPRPYTLGQRTQQIDHSRRQILDAARDLLRETPAYRAFTLDAVAKRADVARGTVYYQFTSKTGLLEAICDDLGHSGGLGDLAEAFTQTDPHTALTLYIRHFARFWQADRTVMRRLRALAALDPEVSTVIAARDHRRRHGLRELASRFQAAPVTDDDPAVRALLALTSFETFDTLAPADQNLEDLAGQVTTIALYVLNDHTAGVRQR